MIKNLKKILCTALVVVVCLTAAPLQGFIGFDWSLLVFSVKASTTESSFGYHISNGEASIYGVDKSISGHVTVPSTIDGYPVTSISNFAFEDCTCLTSVTIPDSITSIGFAAFYGCDSLTDVTIGNGVTHIDDLAFWFCTNLTSLTIGSGLKTIGEHAITLSNIKSITVHPDNTVFSNDSRGVLFNKDKTVLLIYPRGNSATSYCIPDSVTIISDSSFSDCSNLTSITIPDSVTTISDSSFNGCSNLTSIIIPDNVKTIGDMAFANCYNVTSITIGNGLTTIGERALACGSKLSSINVAADNTAYSNDNLGVLFNKDKTILVLYPVGNSATSYCIPDSVTTIGDYAFSGSYALWSITIGSGVTTIGADGFVHVHNLFNIFVDEKNAAFSNDDRGVLFNKDKTELIRYPAQNLASSYSVPDSVVTISDDAFYDCDVRDLTIGCGVKYIGEGAFEETSSLNSIFVDEKNTAYSSDSRGALFNKDKTVLLRYPISNRATSYVIPDGVTTIADGAFERLDYCESIFIPLSVTTVGLTAFFDCPCITDVYYGGTEEQWNEIDIQGPHNYDLTEATIHYSSYHITHTYSSIVTPPTCTEGGYTTYTCFCGDSYIGDYVETKSHSYTSTVTTPATHLTEGVKTFTCICGDTYTKPIDKTTKHSYIVLNVVEATCEANGYTVYICQCGDTYNGDQTLATGHNFNGNKCTTCGKVKDDNCSCNCHKSGFMGFIWKIINFFNKLFGSNKVCACGVSHY